MTKPDDLKPKMYVVVHTILEDKDDEPEYSPWGMMFGGGRAPSRPKYDGKPWQVVAISLPFVCLTDGRVKVSCDTRTTVLQRVTREYALAMDTPAIPEARHASIFLARQPPPDAPDPRDCPRCGHRMTQRLKTPGSGEWPLVCKNCESERPAPKLVVQ